MRTIVRPMAMIAVAAVMAGSVIGYSFAQNAPPASAPVAGSTPPSYVGPGWGPEDEPPAVAEATTPMDRPVLFVTSVEILRSAAQPTLDIVRVTGFAASQGWSAPQLVPTYAGKPADDILDLELIAAPPDESQTAGGFVPVSAILPLEPGYPFKGVRVRASGNAITVNAIPGSSQATISANDCRDCLGKKYVPEGSAPAAQQGAVRQEDLPKVLRVIRATDGIGDTEQDPNRLTLILGADDTIVEAFWE